MVRTGSPIYWKMRKLMKETIASTAMLCSARLPTKAIMVRGDHACTGKALPSGKANLRGDRASFETPASWAPQDEGTSSMASRMPLILRASEGRVSKDAIPPPRDFHELFREMSLKTIQVSERGVKTMPWSLRTA